MYLLGKFLELIIIVTAGLIAIPAAIMCSILRGFMYFAGGFIAGTVHGLKKWKF